VILERYDTRLDWLEARKRGLGGTDIAGILGASKWATPWSVWASKRGLALPENRNEAMDLGSGLEAWVAMEWERRNKTFLRRMDNVIARHDDHPWAFVSPDGFEHDGSGQLGAIDPRMLYEGKVTAGYGEDWGPTGSTCGEGNVPEAYQVQLAWGLAVTGLPRGVLVVLYRGTSIREYTMERDPELSDRLLELAGEWWQKHVVGGEPPPVESSQACTQALTVAAGAPVGDRPMDDELAAAARRYDELRDESKRIDARVKQAANELRALMGDSEESSGSGIKVTWKDGSPPERVDLEQLEQEYPEAYEACRYIGQAARTLRVTVKREK